MTSGNKTTTSLLADVDERARIGFEFEAYAADRIAGHVPGQPVEHERACREIASHLSRLTGLPFTSMTSGAHPRPPSTTLENPRWVVDRDISLDEEFCAPEGFGTGVEIKTPPLAPAQAMKVAGDFWSLLHGSGEFASGPEAGVHVNISMPALADVKAEDLLLLSPCASMMSKSRAAGFSGVKLDLAICAAVMGCTDADSAREIGRRLIRENRGSYETNALPLLEGLGYVEFRHLGGQDFEEDGAASLMSLTSALCQSLQEAPARREDCDRAWHGLAAISRQLRSSPLWYRSLSRITALRRSIEASGKMHETILDSGMFASLVKMIFADPRISAAIPVSSRIRKMVGETATVTPIRSGGFRSGGTGRQDNQATGMPPSMLAQTGRSHTQRQVPHLRLVS